MDLGQFMLCSKLVVTSLFHWLTWCLLCKALTVSKSRPTSPSDKMASFSWIQDFISSQESKNNSTLTPPPPQKKKGKRKRKEKKRKIQYNFLWSKEAQSIHVHTGTKLPQLSQKWQNLTSPYNFHTISSKQLMRILKLINYKLLSWSFTKFSQLIYKELCSSKSGELTIRPWELKG